MDNPVEALNHDRVNAMLRALSLQRNQTADEVVNLLGDLAEARAEIVALKKRVEELQAQATPAI